MSSDLLHPQTKIAPVDDTEDSSTIATQGALESLTLDGNGEVPTYGELQTQIQTPSTNGTNIEDVFHGTAVDLAKSPFPISNDLFEGKIHVLMRDLPGNTYDFAGEKEVLWEIQIQVRNNAVHRYRKRDF